MTAEELLDIPRPRAGRRELAGGEMIGSKMLSECSLNTRRVFAKCWRAANKWNFAALFIERMQKQMLERSV